MPHPKTNTRRYTIRVSPGAKAGLDNLALQLGYTYDGGASLSAMLEAFGKSLPAPIDNESA